MDIIERAEKRLGARPAKSLTENAAERLRDLEIAGVCEPDAVLTADTQRHSRERDVTPRRQTQRQITIDFERLRGKCFALPADQSALAEELRVIKRPLLSAAFAQGPNTVENAT